jgi:hypothetical protein
MQGLVLRFASGTLDSWLEASMHSEGPTTHKLDHGFSCFTLILQQNFPFILKFQFIFHASLSAILGLISKFPPTWGAICPPQHPAVLFWDEA